MTDLADSAVHIWYVRPKEVAVGDRARYAAMLSPEEQARNERFVFEADQHRHLVARALVRTTLSRYAAVDPRAWVFQPNRHGKPQIIEPAAATSLRFSLTHTHGLVAVAVTRHRVVGLDAEHLNRRDCALELAPRFFASAEVDDIVATPAPHRHRRFLEYWTLKEAYIKAVGAGLSMPLDSFAMQLSNPPVISIADDADEGRLWHLSRLDLGPEHLVALAVRDPDCVPVASVHYTIP